MFALFIHHIELLQKAIHLWDDSSKQEYEGSNFPNLFSPRVYIHDFCTSCWYGSCLRSNVDVLGLIVGDRDMFINAVKCGYDRYDRSVCVNPSSHSRSTQRLL